MLSLPGASRRQGDARRGRSGCPSRWGRLPCGVVHEPVDGSSWLAIGEAPLPVGVVHDWCVRPDCGAVVVFSGTVRDHAADGEGTVRDGVVALTYEAFEERVVDAFAAIEATVRDRWPDVGRVALLHRLGRLTLGESSVVVGVSAPHRPVAFEAARYAIDALKATAPIWKHEVWSDGADWGTGAQTPIHPAQVPSPGVGSR